MKSLFHSLIIFLLLFIACSSTETEIDDIIKPVNLVSGITDSMLVNDLFYSKSYEIKFIENKNVRVIYNSSSGMIYFTAAPNFSGMTLIDFEYKNEIYSIPVLARIQNKYKFSYKPDKKYNVLNLFGSFNGWDRGNLPMKDEDADGIFEIEIPLEPGRYEYKFWADGTEIIDPMNPEKKPNGHGDFNSIFNVVEQKSGRQFLHINDKQEKGDIIVLNFLYENEDNPRPLNNEEIFILLDNQHFDDSRIKINNHSISVELEKEYIEKSKLLRIAVCRDGKISNLQSVFLNEMKKDSDSKKFIWNDAIIYSLMIDRFNDGDKSLNKPIKKDSLFDKANYMGGDFQGIIDKIKEGYFDSLGVNTIWLSPVYDNPNEAYKEFPKPNRWFSGYHGYWPISSNDVEEKFGTIEKLKELVALAHKHKIKILLDVVANHVHEKHPLVKEKPEWFGEINLPDGRLNLRLWDEHRLTTWFEPYLPKLNYVNSSGAIDFMTSNTIWWLKETKADGFRQDAVKHIPNEFWRALNKKIKEEVEIPESKTVYQIGETFGSYRLISSYVNNGQLSAQFNFNLYDVALPTFLDKKMSFAPLDAEMKKSFLVYGERNIMGNIMDSHDKNRFMSFADGDLDISQWSATEEGWNNPPKVDNPINYEKAKLYYAFMNTIPGLPVIYYGSEFGMSGASDPDNRRMMKFGNELTEHEKKMLNDVRQIINVRKNHSALKNGDFLTLIADQNIYAFIRSNFEERILVILNKSDVVQKISLSIPEFYKCSTYVDLISGKNISSTNNIFEAEIPETGRKFFKLIK
jgi:glycosidase